MFAKQMATAFQQLTAAGMDRRQAEILLNVLGNCAADLQHRGTVRVDSDWRINPPTLPWPITITSQSPSGGAPHGECEHCQPGTTPAALLLTLGDAIEDGSCTDCIDLLGIYILEQDENDPCTYAYSGTSSCGAVSITLTLGASSIVGSITIDSALSAQISFTATAPYDGGAARTTSTSNISDTVCDLTDTSVSLVAAGQAATIGGLTKDNYDKFFAVLSVANWRSDYDCDTKEIIGGLAAKFKGAVYIEKIICPDGSCLDCSAVANMPTTLTPVRRSGGSRIVQNGDGNYELQDHMFTDLVSAEVTDHGWETRYTFPSIPNVATEITWDANGNKKIQQTQLGNVFVVGHGDENTSDVLEAQQVSRFVKNVNYDTAVHILSEHYATEVYVFSAGPTASGIVDVAEPCSGTGVEPSIGIAQAAMTVGAAQLSASATMTERTYSATSAMTAGAATLSGQATFSAKVYGSTAAFTAGAATLSASAVFTEPVYTATAALTAPSATLSAAGQSRGIDCEHCTEGTTPVSVSVQFDNTITGGTCAQEDCQAIVNGGPYTLNQSGSNPCEYQGQFNTDCGTFFITFSFLSLSKQISIGLGPVSTEHIWTVAANAPYDGMESVIFLPQADGSVNVCDWSAIEATVTIPAES